MPKSKDAPSLFELVTDEPVATPSQPEEPQEYYVPASDPQPVVAEPWVQEDGNRIRFSLSTVGLAIGIISIGMALLASFALGRYFGGQEPEQRVVSGQQRNDSDDAINLLMATEPNGTVTEDVEKSQRQWEAERESEKPRSESTSRWIRNLNYIWIDTFASESDALTAQAFLDEQDIATELVDFGEQTWRLITATGFDYRIPEQKSACIALTQRIGELGIIYMERGGRYKFRYQVTKLKADNW